MVLIYKRSMVLWLSKTLVYYAPKKYHFGRNTIAARLVANQFNKELARTKWRMNEVGISNNILLSKLGAGNIVNDYEA